MLLEDFFEYLNQLYFSTYHKFPFVKSYLDYEDEHDIWSIRRIAFEDKQISQKDKMMIDAVVDEFSAFSATSLVNLTHNQDPWTNVYEQHKNNEITNDSLMEYFND